MATAAPGATNGPGTNDEEDTTIAGLVRAATNSARRALGGKVGTAAGATGGKVGAGTAQQAAGTAAKVASKGAKAGVKVGVKAGAKAGAKAGVKVGVKAGAKAGAKAGVKAGAKVGAKAGVKVGAGAPAQGGRFFTKKLPGGRVGKAADMVDNTATMVEEVTGAAAEKNATTGGRMARYWSVLKQAAPSFIRGGVLGTVLFVGYEESKTRMDSIVGLPADHPWLPDPAEAGAGAEDEEGAGRNAAVSSSSSSSSSSNAAPRASLGHFEAVGKETVGGGAAGMAAGGAHALCSLVWDSVAAKAVLAGESSKLATRLIVNNVVMHGAMFSAFEGTKTALAAVLPCGRDRNSGVGFAAIFGAGCNAAFVGKCLEATAPLSFADMKALPAARVPLHLPTLCRTIPLASLAFVALEYGRNLIHSEEDTDGDDLF